MLRDYALSTARLSVEKGWWQSTGRGLIAGPDLAYPLRLEQCAPVSNLKVSSGWPALKCRLARSTRTPPCALPLGRLGTNCLLTVRFAMNYRRHSDGGEEVRCGTASDTQMWGSLHSSGLNAQVVTLL